ncbi:MAG TPA: thioredoxin domain-containing protein [Candidatus Methylomirabilis sp.]|nr:thioredoxin domain-containing protein [Candidatus Methylomirabilis sp.]
MNSQTDPRTPFVFGIIALGVVLLGGIVWAVAFAPADAGDRGRTDVNVSFRDENDPSLGPVDSQNVLRIFGDFQCPACKAAEAGMNHVRRTYASQLKIVWDDFPLSSIHRNARAAANAARCAEEQGKFWEMHDALYDFQTSWSDKADPSDEFKVLANRIQLDVQSFTACYNERTYDAKVTADVQEGNANRVDSTPTFFLNNRKIVGVLSPAEWDREIKALLGPLADISPAAASPASSMESASDTVSTPVPIPATSTP